MRGRRVASREAGWDLAELFDEVADRRGLNDLAVGDVVPLEQVRDEHVGRRR